MPYEPLAFDAPVFKKLAHNDTGQAMGHQGGIVIPQELGGYFPQLDRQVTATQPTVDRQIRVVLVKQGSSPQFGISRYQYQTWGGTRPHERRLTGGLKHLRDAASKDDILLIERSLDDRDLYRLTLLTRGTVRYGDVEAQIGTARWGTLREVGRPVSELELEAAQARLTAIEAKPLTLFDDDASMVESRTVRIARSQAFKTRLIALYDGRCAVCGNGLFRPDRVAEVEAAHIVPRALRGADDPRNGITLCRKHHWAFDQGLIAASSACKVTVSKRALMVHENESLNTLSGRTLLDARETHLRPSLDAFDWHRRNVFID